MHHLHIGRNRICLFFQLHDGSRPKSIIVNLVWMRNRRKVIELCFLNERADSLTDNFENM